MWGLALRKARLLGRQELPYFPRLNTSSRPSPLRSSNKGGKFNRHHEAI